jgi:hypothetical protein
MALRRELLPLLLAAAFLLIGPAQALAAPTWLDAEGQDGTDSNAQVVDVATDADGNSAAVWLAAGEVRAAFRPRGGPWGASESLDPGTTLVNADPRVEVQPNGEFVAAWVADRVVIDDGYPIRFARRPAGGDWTGAQTIDGIGCCPALGELMATADGSVTLVALDEGSPSTYRKPPGSDTFGAEEFPPSGSQGQVFAGAPDGGVVSVRSTFCDPVNCVVAARRPPGGPWGPEETVATLAPGDVVTGLAVTGTPDASFTAVWGEATQPEGFAPPGRVRSATRVGPGVWSPQTVVQLPNDVPGCPNFDNCFDVAAAADGTQLALWQQAGQMSAALRSGPVSAWGATEDAGDIPVSTAVPYGAFTAGGVPVAAWGSPSAGGAAIGTHRQGGAWAPVTLGPTVRGGPPPDAVFLGDLAADGAGDALTAWRDGSGVATAGFDAAAPRFTALSLPSGESQTFSAAAGDNWSGVASIFWQFGDGTSTIGGTVQHAYGSPGVYTASATATDGVGNAAQQGGPVTVTQKPPPPDPCGTADADKDGIKDACDDSNGAARPRAFKTVNATVVSGEVFVKLPRGSAGSSQASKPPKGFVPLEGAETIPVGATLDTRRGRVKVRSAATTGRRTQTGQFFRGRFLIRQVRIKKRSKSLITDMRLTGSSFRSACGANRASVSQKRKRSKKRVRRLFGNAKGRFRTSGRNAAATVRGTRWSIQDRCDGTLVTVQRGRVEVRDKVRRKTRIVRTGHKYLARAR